MRAAKVSLYCALFASFANLFQRQSGMPALGHWALLILVGALILGGIAIGIIALIKNRQHRYPGVSKYAISGITINSIFVGANLWILVWGRSLLG